MRASFHSTARLPAIRDAESGLEDAGHVEDVPLVGERIRAIAAAIRGIGQEGRAVDVVLLGRVVNCVRPGVRREELDLCGPNRFFNSQVQRRCRFELPTIPRRGCCRSPGRLGPLY